MEMMGEMDMGGMSMFFTAGTNVTILFDSWRTTDAWSLFGSVVSTFRFHYNIKFHFQVTNKKIKLKIVIIIFIIGFMSLI